MSEEAVVRLNRNDFTAEFRQELPVPVIRIAAIKVVRLLMQAGSKRRRQQQASSNLGDSHHLFEGLDGARHVLQYFRAQDDVEAFIRNWNARDVRHVVEGRV